MECPESVAGLYSWEGGKEHLSHHIPHTVTYADKQRPLRNISWEKQLVGMEQRRYW